MDDITQAVAVGIQHRYFVFKGQRQAIQRCKSGNDKTSARAFGNGNLPVVGKALGQHIGFAVAVKIPEIYFVVFRRIAA